MSNFIIKLGGSVISNEQVLINFKYIRELKKVIEKFVADGHRFGIVLGGGYTMRRYRDLARSEGMVNNVTDLHWIGTTVNVLHAEIVRTVFSEIAMPRPMMYEDYYIQKSLDMQKPVIIGGGSRAGVSGDVCSILLAKRLQTDTIITLKNIDYLYSSDPKSNPDAKIIKEATWDEYWDIIGRKSEHEPGGNYPVDPIATKMAKEEKMKFVLMGGENLENFTNYISGKNFIGSVIM